MNQILEVEKFYDELFAKLYFTIDRCAAELKRQTSRDKQILDRLNSFDGRGYYDING